MGMTSIGFSCPSEDMLVDSLLEGAAVAELPRTNYLRNISGDFRGINPMRDHPASSWRPAPFSPPNPRKLPEDRVRPHFLLQRPIAPGLQVLQQRPEAIFAPRSTSPDPGV